MASSFQRLQHKQTNFNKIGTPEVIKATVEAAAIEERQPVTRKISQDNIQKLKQDSKGLNQAFKQFSELSNEILNSYTDLEHRVETLNEELRVVSQKRLDDFEQKHAIASRLQSLLSILPSGVILLDGKGRVSQSNPVAEKLLGNNLLGSKWFDIVATQFAMNSEKMHQSVLNDGRRLHVATCPLEFEAGQLIVLTDVSNMHRLQSHVDRNKRLAIVGRAMSTLSHQLRTPLSTALLYVSHLQSNAFDETQKKDMARKLQGRLQQMNSQIDDMLLFARGGQEQASKINMQHWLDANKEQIEDIFKLSNVTGEIINTAQKDCEIFVNEHAFSEALYSLIVNACEAVTKQTVKQVSLKIQQLENHLMIQVSDSGEGISEGVKEDLFDPFITSKSSGTGLGLAIVQAVITSSGGHVNWRNKKNAGAEFTILMPLVQDLHVTSEDFSDIETSQQLNNKNYRSGNHNSEQLLQKVEGL